MTLDLNANNQLVLRGTSRNIASPGSLGNLGTTDVDAFEEVVLPPAIRSHGEPLVLDPIPLSAAARALHPDLETVGGLVGYITALMENDQVSAGEAEVAHREFNRSMRDSVKDAIDEFVVPSVIQHPTADDIKVLFRETLGPRIETLVNERRNQWATFPNYAGDDQGRQGWRPHRLLRPSVLRWRYDYTGRCVLQEQPSRAVRLHGRATGIETTNTERTLERGIEVGATESGWCAVRSGHPGHDQHRLSRRQRSHAELVRGCERPALPSSISARYRSKEASGDPFTYVEASTNNLIVLYRGDDNHVHVIYWGPGTSMVRP